MVRRGPARRPSAETERRAAWLAELVERGAFDRASGLLKRDVVDPDGRAIAAEIRLEGRLARAG